MSAIKTTIALLAFLLAPLTHAADVAPAAAPTPASCAKATYIRPSDGAIVTRTVCVVAQEAGK